MTAVASKAIMATLSAQEALDLIRNANWPDALGFWQPGLVGLIGDIEEPDVYRALAVLLREEPPEMRARAARLLGDAENPEALEALGPLLMDPDGPVRFWAVWAVEQFGAVDDFFVPSNPEARSALELAANDADADAAQAQRILSQSCGDRRGE
jgi:HEAT repeat protein